MSKMVFILAVLLITFSYLIPQCVRGDCENGYGEGIYKSGDRYIGEWRNGKIHGFGTYYWKNDDKYVGESRYGEFNGYGTFYSKGRKVYEGEFKNNKYHGKGVWYFEDGSKYDGDFIDGKKEGQGTYYGKDGEYYKGAYKNDLLNGKGILIWGRGSEYCGDKYEGEFKDSLLHGKGIYYWTDGRKYDGYFINGKKEGQGTYTYANGDKYIGGWENNKRSGHGTFYGKDGEYFEGIYKNDFPNGKGISIWGKNSKYCGDKYEGEFKDSWYHGKGIYYWTDGRKYDGYFINGKKEGQGTLYAKDGKIIYSGIWKNDEFVKEASSYYAIVILDPNTLGGPVLINEGPVPVSKKVVDIGVGHIAIILDTDNEVYYYSKAKPSVNKKYDSIKGFLIDKIDNDYNSRYTQKYRIKIDKDSYDLMTKRAIEKLKEDYRIKSNNCVHFVHAVLEAGKLIVPNPNCSPKDYFNSLTKSGLGEIYNEN
jgi:hypothetical protein